MAVKAAAAEEAEGPTPPSPLVGESGYPKVPVSLGISPYGDPALRDSPQLWARAGLSLEEVARLRTEMLYPFKNFDVRRPEELLKGDLAWGAVSYKPVDAEAKLSGKPRPPSFDGILSPIGVSARAEEVKVVDNPKVDPLLERRAEEGVKAEEAIKELFKRGIDIYLLQKALSVGLLGKRKRLVPSRWAITAVDVAVSKALKEDLLKMKWTSSVKAATYSHYGNVYKVILLPGPPAVEMLEVWEPRSLWTPKEVTIHNFEGPAVRARALDPDDGGFHALKVGALKAMWEKGVSATALIIRRITPDYYLPLGSWQIREGAYAATLRALEGGDLTLREALEAINDEKASEFKVLKQRSLSEYTPRGARPPRA